MVDKKEQKIETGAEEAPTYTRREALAAMAKYSAAVGGSATAIVTADAAVAQAAAYPWWCEWFWWLDPSQCGYGNSTYNTGNRSSEQPRIRY